MANKVLSLAKKATAWAMLLATAAIVLAPQEIAGLPRRESRSFTAPRLFADTTHEHQYLLGTDYLGRCFVASLGGAVSETARVAMAGTAAVLLGVLLVGTLHGTVQSRALGSLLTAGNLGVMAVPEIAVLVAVAAAWPRTAPPWEVNTSMVAVLVFFAIPPGARLVAERVRAVNRAGFVTASRACGATYRYTLRHDVWPHLREDAAWVLATVLPRFVAVEVGLAYLGVEYREFEGLGRLLSKNFNNLVDPTARFHMLVTIVAILWIALLPQVVLRCTGLRSSGDHLS